MCYWDFFESLTGFVPNQFQEQVAAALLAEKSVVLRAPTGSGKTWAVVAPFLYALSRHLPIADRLLYALPLRSLATSLFDSTKAAAKQHEYLYQLADRVRIQTGERREDDRFDGLMTFTTIDQLLSSYLLQPVGLPQRCGNLNAGALIGALICFDEFHLLEPSKSMATTLEMLDTLAVSSRLSQFVLMTATLSSKSLKRLAERLNADLIEVSQEEADKLPTQQGRTRKYCWIPEPLTAHAVARRHNEGRSIVVVNTVRKAQALYEELISGHMRPLLGPQTRIRLLHSRYFNRDRQVLESDLATWFGTAPTENDVILVSTQVIEAGMDFSCDNLHTELAPMNALIQRAGRCARRRNEKGTVWCYALDVNDAGRPTYGPYRKFKEIVDHTAEVLSECVEGGGRLLSYHDELRLVDLVHTKWEEGQDQPINDIRPRVRMAMNGDRPAAVRELVRDVDSINAIITDSPESMRFNGREWPEMLSVPTSSLWGLFESDAGVSSTWIAKAAREVDVSQSGSVSINWEPITEGHKLVTAGWLIAIHPSCASYSPEFGLVIGKGAPPPETRYRQRPKATRYRYSRETYDEHIRRVRSAGTKQNLSYQIATRRLAAAMKVSGEELIRWLDLLWVLHDVGKLTISWQDAIWNWQSSKTGIPSEPRPALAHSDYDPDTDYLLSRDSLRRPPHAAEGALAVSSRLEDELSDYAFGVYQAAVTAIARHHSPQTSQVSAYRLLPDAVDEIADRMKSETVMPLVDGDCQLRREEFAREDLFLCTDPNLERFVPLYLYCCRRLRLADQASFGEE